MIDDDEWSHTEPRWPGCLCVIAIAGMLLAAWGVAVLVTLGMCWAMGK